MNTKSNRNAHGHDAISDMLNVDHLTLCFLPNGDVNFYPTTTNPRRLAAALAKIVQLMNADPQMAICASGACADHDAGVGGVH